MSEKKEKPDLMQDMKKMDEEVEKLARSNLSETERMIAFTELMKTVLMKHDPARLAKSMELIKKKMT